MYHQAGDKYVRALIDCADVTPVLLPSVTPSIDIAEITAFADGILFPGGYSNIERHRYGLPDAPASEHQDPARDAVTLSLLPAAIASGLPLMCICRGLQELNVALGGTLYPRLQDIKGRMDHREDTSDPIDIQYGFAHSVSVNKGGILANILGSDADFMVNSVHGQGINRLANGLTIEATAADETIEAVSVENAKAFAIGLQWHPEWKAQENPQSLKLFEAFGEAVRVHKSNRVTQEGQPKKRVG